MTVLGQATVLCLMLGVALAGCESFDRSTPVQVWRDIFLDENRPEPAPGADRPFPNLASVPPRPTPPDPATRAGIYQALAADRAGSLAPLPPRGDAGVGFVATPGFGATPAAALGQPPMPPGPPPAASLSAPPLRPLPIPAAGRAAGFGPTAIAPDPGVPPPPPPAELLAPPPPPPADMLAPPRLR